MTTRWSRARLIPWSMCMAIAAGAAACMESAPHEDAEVATRSAALSSGMIVQLEASPAGTIVPGSVSLSATAAFVTAFPSAAPPSVSRLGAGEYMVTLQRVGSSTPDAAGHAGNVQVVAKGGGNARCSIAKPWHAGSDGRVTSVIACTTPAGSPVDAGFYFSFGRAPTSGATAYGYVQSTGSMPAARAFSSAGSGLAAARIGLGRYRISLPVGLGARGAVQISAVERTVDCHVINRYTVLGPLLLEVECWSRAGALSDAAFAFHYAATDSLAPGGVGAFVEVAGAAIVMAKSHNACVPGSHAVTRESVGVYTLEHTRLGALNPSYHVTAVGSGDRYCKVLTAAAHGASSARARVGCFARSGAPVDTSFVETYGVRSSDCGGCDVDCQGGACVLGVCQPVTLASDVRPTSIEANATDVYWTAETLSVPGDSHPVVQAVARSGGAVRTVTDTERTGSHPSSRRSSIQLGPDTVYWIEELRGVHAAPLVGGAGARLGSTGVGVPVWQSEGLVLDGGQLFWANAGADALLTVSPTGATARILMGSPSGGSWYPHALAVDATHVYFLHDTGARLGRVPRAGGTGELLYTAGGSPTGVATSAIATDGSHVYFAIDREPGRILRVPSAGGATTTFATSSGIITGLAIDDDTLYFTDRSGFVKRVALSGGAPVTLASGENQPRAIWVDDSTAIWANADAVRKLAH